MARVGGDPRRQRAIPAPGAPSTRHPREETTMAIDQDRLMDFLHRFVGDLGAALAAGNVVIGHRLGFFAALAPGPATAEELAQRTGTDPRYVTEWLRGQASGGYVERSESDGKETYSL